MIGIPYAWNCQACARAVICPCCGLHLKRDDYAKHFTDEHNEETRRPWSGTENVSKLYCDHWTPERIQVAVERGKREIRADIARGRIPVDEVLTFADLHDYVDANEYAGLCDDGVDPETTPINEIQNALSEWIQSGALAVGRICDGPCCR